MPHILQTVFTTLFLKPRGNPEAQALKLNEQTLALQLSDHTASIDLQSQHV